jgi:hypothetical protein
VAGIQQSVQVGSAPSRVHVNADLEHGADLPQGVDGYGTDVPTLDQADESARDSGSIGNVLLAPVAAQADGAKSGSNA